MPDVPPAIDPAGWDPAACVAAGAQLLDQHQPGWRDRVDPARLDMGEGVYQGQPTCRACVGAQLDYHHRQRGVAEQDAEGDYGAFLWALLTRLDLLGADFNARRAFAIRHGFEIPDELDPSDEDNPAAWAQLTAAWQALLTGSTP